MSALRTASDPTPVASGTLPQLFRTAVERYRNDEGRPAFQWFEGEALRSMSHAEAHERVLGLARALRDLGLERGDRAAILSENRPEWALADYACLCGGIIDVPVYSTLTGPQVAYILNDSGARIVFVSTEEQLTKAVEARAECPALEWIVVFDPVTPRPEGVLAWDDLVSAEPQGEPSDFEAWFQGEVDAARPDDVATILYTSGTTGTPKGVMLTHNNLFSNVAASSTALVVGDRWQTLSFLPLSHVFQRMVDYLLFSKGCSIAYARSIQTVSDDIRTVRPTIVVSVPRLYEKIFNKVTAATGPRGALVAWARRVGEAWADARLGGRSPGPWLSLRYRIADGLVFRKLRDAVGGRLHYFVSGGAPLAPEIARFFYACGLPILEGYGLTETSPVTNVNRLEDVRIGTVGPPVPGTEIRIAQDGEVLIRGPQVMKGYYRMPEATREAIDDDGWFRTGDIGELDADGYLKITDRKKDLIVTAGGKNIAPQPIENRLKMIPCVEQVVMLGDRRKFPVVLVVPDFAVLRGWLGSAAAGLDPAALVRDPRVQGRVEAELLPVLDELAPFERPKKIGLLAQEFSIENGMLTPTQKVRRRVVQKELEPFIDSLYDAEAVDRTVIAAA